MLKLVLDTLEGIDAGIAALYTKGADGRFHLETDEDETAKAKLKEFRDNNIKLLKERDDLMAKFKDIDPDKYKEFQKKAQEIEDKKLLDAGEIDKLVDQKVERMKQDFENQITAMKTALTEKDNLLNGTSQRLSEVLIDSEITKAVTSVGSVRKEAMRDIIARGREVWKLEENKPVPKQGDKILYGKDGKAPMTFDEWAKVLQETAPFLFEGSGGGGAAGGGGFSGGNVDWSKIPANERLKLAHGGQQQK